LDLVTHLVITNVLLHVKRKLAYIFGKWQIGQAKELASWQMDFCADWQDMT
jgi:hypothetical protein